ncbi:MAG: hypothetical protein P8N19_01165 [Flavobacteriales bacterium]|nr:hypothetical protein [Flavobacteriales bacterium]
MKKYKQKAIFFFALTILLFSCRSSKDRIDEAKQAVTSFIKDLELENYSSVNKMYPGFSKIGKYWLLNDFTINDSKIENDIVTIYASYKKGGQIEEAIMFVLKEDADKKYFIDKSKGLSAFFGSSLYKFAKAVGCLRGLETDQEIAAACKKREKFFSQLLEDYKENIESAVKLENHNVSSGYGFVSGDVTVKNNSAIEIPAFSYDLYIILYDNQHNEIFRTKSMSHVYPIPANGSINAMINETFNRGMSRIGVEIKLNDLSFLENKLTNPPSDWDCEFVDAFVNGNMDEYIRKHN